MGRPPLQERATKSATKGLRAAASARGEESERGEGGEPMFSDVVARHVRQARAEMTFGGNQEPRPSWIVVTQRARQAPQTPRATQVQPVEMANLRVLTVADLRGLEKGDGLTHCQAGQ